MSSAVMVEVYCKILRGFSMKLSKVLYTCIDDMYDLLNDLYWFLINNYRGMHGVFTCSHFFTNTMSMVCFSSFPFSHLLNFFFFWFHIQIAKKLRKCWKLVCDKSDKKFIRYLIKSEICWEEKCHHRHACNNMSIQSVRVGFIFQVIKKMNGILCKSYVHFAC